MEIEVEIEVQIEFTLTQEYQAFFESLQRRNDAAGIRIRKVYVPVGVWVQWIPSAGMERAWSHVSRVRRPDGHTCEQFVFAEKPAGSL